PGRPVLGRTRRAVSRSPVGGGLRRVSSGRFKRHGGGTGKKPQGRRGLTLVEPSRFGARRRLRTVGRVGSSGLARARGSRLMRFDLKLMIVIIAVVIVAAVGSAYVTSWMFSSRVPVVAGPIGPAPAREDSVFQPELVWNAGEFTVNLA